MKLLITGILIGAGIFLAGHVFAADVHIPYRDFGYIGNGDNSQDVTKFVDPDNGNVCYISGNGNRGGISCVKP